MYYNRAAANRNLVFRASSLLNHPKNTHRLRSRLAALGDARVMRYRRYRHRGGNAEGNRSADRRAPRYEGGRAVYKCDRRYVRGFHLPIDVRPGRPDTGDRANTAHEENEY